MLNLFTPRKVLHRNLFDGSFYGNEGEMLLWVSTDRRHNIAEELAGTDAERGEWVILNKDVRGCVVKKAD